MKSLHLIIALTCLAHFIHAQTSDQDRASRFLYGFSVEGGYSGYTELSKVEDTNMVGPWTFAQSQKRRPGFAFGLWVGYRLNDWSELFGEVNYGSWRSFAAEAFEIHNFTGDLINYSLDRYESAQHLLRIPIQTHIYLSHSQSGVRPFLSVGIQAAYMTALRQSLHHQSWDPAQEPIIGSLSKRIPLGSDLVDLHRWQWSAIGGIGIQLNRARLSIQRNWAFTNVPYEAKAYFQNIPRHCRTNILLDDYSLVSCNYRLNQLQQTSLHFSYRIF